MSQRSGADGQVPAIDMTTPEETPSESHRAVRNMVSLLGSRVAIAVMGWAGTVIMVRALSPEDWGKFSFVFGVLGMMSIVTDLGVGRVVLARLTGDDHLEIGRVASNFIALRALLGLVGYVVAVGFVLLSGYPSDVVLATAIGGLVVVVATPSHALTVMFQSRLRLSYVAVGEMLAQVVQLALTILAALINPLLLIFVLPAVANEIVSALIKLRGVRKGITAKPVGRPELWRWKEMLIEAVPLSIGFAFIEITSKVDVLMLGKLDTFDAVGMYTIGFKFSDFVLVAAMAVITPFTTLLVSAWPSDPDGFRNASRRATVIITLFCAVGLAAFWPVTGSILDLLYGSRFVEATTSTRLLVAAGVMGALSQLGLMILVAAGRHRVYPWVALAALALNVGLNIWLIPRYSYPGAAWAMVISQAVMLIALGVVIKMSIAVPRLFPLTSVVGSMSIAIAVIAALTYVPWLDSLPWPVIAVIGALATVLVAHLFGWTAGLSLRALMSRVRGQKAGR